MSDIHDDEQGIKSRIRRGRSQAAKIRKGKKDYKDGSKKQIYSSTQKMNPQGVFSHFPHIEDEYSNADDLRRVRTTQNKRIMKNRRN